MIYRCLMHDKKLICSQPYLPHDWWHQNNNE